MAKSQRQRLNWSPTARRSNCYEPKIAEFAKLVNPTETLPQELKSEISSLEEELKKLRNLETKVEMKFQNYQTILEKGICPTCDQKIVAGDFRVAIAHKEAELAETKQKVHSFDNDLRLKKSLLESKTHFDQAQARLGDFRKSISEYEENIKIWQDKFDEAFNDEGRGHKGIGGRPRQRAKARTKSTRI